MANKKTMQETVETKPMNDSDVMVLDYINQLIFVFDKGREDLIAEETNVDIASIYASLRAHENREEHDEVYVINGYTFINVKDFARYPIQASLGFNNPSTNSSIKLWVHYVKHLIHDKSFIEVFDIEEGSIKQYYSLIQALKSVDASYFDVLAVPLKEQREIIHIDHYVLPAALNKYIFRIQSHPVSWSEYIALAMNDYETHELLVDQSHEVISDHFIEQEAKEERQFELNYSALTPQTHWFNQYFIEKQITPLMMADILINGTDEDRKIKLLMDPSVLNTEKKLDGWYEVMDDRIGFLSESDKRSKAQKVLYPFVYKHGTELAVRSLADKGKLKPEYFESERGRLLFYLLHTEGKTRCDGLGINPFLYNQKPAATVWRDNILSIIGTDNQDAVEALHRLYSVIIDGLKDNLLDGHPDGLGKHIKVYNGEGECITEEEIEEYWSLGDIPFFVTYEGKRYLFILSSDLTCGCNPDRTKTLDTVSDIVNGCMYWIDQAFEHLKFDKSKAVLGIIGIKDPVIAVGTV